MKSIPVRIGVGELADRLTILEIKERHARSIEQRSSIRRELDRLSRARSRAGLGSPALDRELCELRSVNSALWDIEDELRACERHGEFGPRFVELARAVYTQNDRRAAVKRAIDQEHRSSLREEKIYTVAAERSGLGR